MPQKKLQVKSYYGRGERGGGGRWIFLAPLILNTVKKATWFFHKIEKLLNCWILKISSSDIAKSDNFLVEVIFNNRFTTTYIKYQEALKRTRIGDLLILSVTLAVLVDNPQPYADWKVLHWKWQVILLSLTLSLFDWMINI